MGAGAIGGRFMFGKSRTKIYSENPLFYVVQKQVWSDWWWQPTTSIAENVTVSQPNRSRKTRATLLRRVPWYIYLLLRFIRTQEARSTHNTRSNKRIQSQIFLAPNQNLMMEEKNTIKIHTDQANKITPPPPAFQKTNKIRGDLNIDSRFVGRSTKKKK